MHPKNIAIVTASCLAIAHVGQARAACPTEDFERFALGTVITTQVPGVTFSTVGNSCGSSSPIRMVVASPSGGTSSGTKALRIQGGCPDFSIDYLRMVFARPQRELEFTVGDGPINLTIRVYANTSGGAPIRTIPVTAGAGVHYLVRIPPFGATFRRVEIEDNISLFEAIDDLTYNIDSTPPNVEFTAPGFDACVCDSVSVQGTACDPDGDYGSDRLEWRAVNSDGPWTLSQTFTSPVCSNGTLYSWNANAPGITEGHYYLRSTVENACGLSDTDIATVYVSKNFNLSAGAFRTPVDSALIGGEACLDGSIGDRCFSHYTVEYRAVGSSTWIPVDAAHPTYTSPVSNDPFALWDTRALPDGDYEVRVTGADICGHATSIVRSFSLDNTAPDAVITEPLNCDFVDGLVTFRGSASDANLQSWVLEWYDAAGGHTGSGLPGWVTINSGTTDVVNGVLGVWDTDFVPDCAHAVRLRVSDHAQVGRASCDFTSHQSVYQLALNVGQVCPTK